jgi:hypothetical protein
MKKFLSSIILAVLLVSPAFAGKLYELTSDLNDSIVAAVDPQESSGGSYPEFVADSQFGPVFTYTSEQISYITNGAVADRQGLFAISGGEWIEKGIDAYGTPIWEYVPNSAKLEPVIDRGEYSGQPIVANVQARQIPGTKNVGVDFFLQLDSGKISQDPYIEMWFRASQSDIQWERCMEISVSDGAWANLTPKQTSQWDEQSQTMQDSLTDHTIRFGTAGDPTQYTEGVVNLIWDAGSEKPNFKTENAQIRIRVIYSGEAGEKPYPHWDGYEVSLGKMFIIEQGANVLEIKDPSLDSSDPDYYNKNLQFFENYITTNSIPRAGTFEFTHEYGTENLPVFSLSADDIQILTGSNEQGGTFVPDSEEVTDEFGGVTYKAVLRRMIEK